MGGTDDVAGANVPKGNALICGVAFSGTDDLAASLGWFPLDSWGGAEGVLGLPPWLCSIFSASSLALAAAISALTVAIIW